MEQTRGPDKDKLGEVSKIETGTEDFGVGRRHVVVGGRKGSGAASDRSGKTPEIPKPEIQGSAIPTGP